MSEQTTCSACEQLGQTPSPEHLASVAAFAEQAAATKTVERLERERDAWRQTAKLMEAQRDDWKARAERAEAACVAYQAWEDAIDEFGGDSVGYADWMDRVDALRKSARAALAERGEG